MGFAGRRNRGEGITGINPSITAETAQPTFHGNPCPRCKSTIRMVRDKRCVRCYKQYRHDHEHKSHYRKHGGALHRKLGLTPAAYLEMCEAQGWACKICKRTPSSKLHVDHNHETGKIRGLLCGSCNVGLGHFSDDPARLEVAIEYLKSC